MKHRLIAAGCVMLMLIGWPGLIASTRAAPDAVFIVNTTNDTVDVSPGDGVCLDAAGNCSLRAAVLEANALAGADTITLPAGTYTLTLAGAGEDAAGTGDLDVTSGTVTIDGAGSGVCGNAGVSCVNANNIDRVFQVLNTGALNLTGVTITGGNAQNSYGGGISVYGLNTALTLTGCRITSNTTNTGAGSDMIGGGIDVVTGTVTISNSIISNNLAWNNGGGLSNYDGAVTVINSTISGNDGASGGGIANSQMSRTTVMTLTNSAVISNTASSGTSAVGGGIANNGTLTANNVTLADNTTPGYGGAVGDTSTNAVTTLNFVTVAGNSNRSDSAALDFYNTTLTLRNTIVAGNTNGNFALGTSASLVSLGYNLSDSAIPSAVGTDIQSSATVNLLPLANNGGPTLTRALGDGSAAINVIGDGVNGCAANTSVDQRSAVRASGANRGETGCDIGAYEYHSDQKPNAVTLRDLSASTTGAWGSWVFVAALLGLGAVWFSRRNVKSN